MGKVWVVDAIALHFSTELGPNDCSMRVLKKQINILKWHDVSNSNSWFLAILNGFSRRFAFIQANIFFLKLKSILI